MNNKDVFTILAILFIAVGLLNRYFFLQIFVGLIFIFVMLKYYDPLEGTHYRLNELKNEEVIPL